MKAQRDSYDAFAAAKRHASLRSASVKEKTLYALAAQGRNRRAVAIRSTFTIIQGGKIA